MAVLLEVAAAVGLFVCVSAGCSYEAHWDRIGPRSEQAKRDEFTCTTRAACPT